MTSSLLPQPSGILEKFKAATVRLSAKFMGVWMPWFFVLQFLHFLQCRDSRDIFIGLRSRAKSYGELHLIVPDKHTLLVICLTAAITLILYWLLYGMVTAYVRYRLKRTLLEQDDLDWLLKRNRLRGRHAYLSNEAQRIVQQNRLERLEQLEREATYLGTLQQNTRPRLPLPSQNSQNRQNRQRRLQDEQVDNGEDDFMPHEENLADVEHGGRVTDLLAEQHRESANTQRASSGTGPGTLPATSDLQGKQEAALDPTLAFFLGQDILSEERRTFIRSYSYQTLQAALRNAPKYEKASLLQIATSRDHEKVYDLFLDNTLIGSGRWAHIALRDVRVSPVHARIRRIDSRYVMYDLLSAHGIRVNDRKLLRPKALIHGDVIGIGRARFRFRAS